MEVSNLIPHVESLIFASDKPLTSLELTDLINNAFGFMEDKVVLDQIESAVEAIIEKYNSEFYPFEVRQSGGGWQFLTKRDYHKTVAQLNGEKFLKRLSTAALETLAIIAYKQPVTKAEIEAIRGVSSDYAIQKLLEKDLIIITGRNETMPGHPLVYATSKSFMDYFGLNSVEDLPKLKEIFDDSLVNPTLVTPESATGVQSETSEDVLIETEEEGVLLVSETGELILDTATKSEEEESEGSEEPSEEAIGEEQENEETDQSSDDEIGQDNDTDKPEE